MPKEIRKNIHRVMKSEKNLTGKQFGRWRVTGAVILKNGIRFWPCVCSCKAKTKKYVYEQNLLSGKSLSCGCISRENAKERIRDLSGQKFGSLIVESRAENRHNRVAWNCLCDCGVRKVVIGHDLTSGHTASCGGKSHRLERGMRNLSGQKFGSLTVLFPTEKRNYKGSVLWHCKCACGNEADISEDALVHGNYKSCGCQKKSQASKLTSYHHFYNGTCLEYLKRPLRSDNRTGVAGVYTLPNGMYKAGIGFMGEKYYLGRFNTFEEAVSARKYAEEKLFIPFIKAFEAWVHGGEEKFYFHVDRINDSFRVESNYLAAELEENAKGSNRI